MNIPIATLQTLIGLGLTTEQMAGVVNIIVEIMEDAKKARGTGAERQARYRARGGGKIPGEMRELVFRRDDYTCVYCGSVENLCCDHDVPVSRGGQTVVENLVTACIPCNSRKKDRDRKTFQKMLSTENPGNFLGNSEETTVKEIPPTPPKEITTTNLNIKPPVPLSEPIGFDAFWAEYPKRDGNADRKGALKAFGPALRRAGGPEPIIAGAKAYAVHCREKGKTGTEYVKQARSWLNGDLWLEWQPKAPEQVETVSNGKTWVKYGGDLWDHCNAGYTKDHGKSAPTDTRGGWYFDAKYLPTEYPQEQAA